MWKGSILRAVVYTGEEKKLVCNLKVTTSPVRNLISTSRVVHFGDIGCIGDAALWPRTCTLYIVQWAKTFDDSIETFNRSWMLWCKCILHLCHLTYVRRLGNTCY